MQATFVATFQTFVFVSVLDDDTRTAANEPNLPVAPSISGIRSRLGQAAFIQPLALSLSSETL